MTVEFDHYLSEEGGPVVETLSTFNSKEHTLNFLACTRCGGTAFHVGKAAYQTTIRCITCQIPCSVHSG